MLWVNGVKATNAVTPLAPAATSQPLWIGARTSAINAFVDPIHHFGLADFALTAAQVASYDRWAKAQFHQI
jgi:hypothetical protein